MKLGDIMSTPVVTVEADDRLGSLRELFNETGYHHLLVVSAGKLRGIISRRDLSAALSPKLGTPAELPEDAATLNRRAHQIMHREVIYLRPSDEILSAVKAFNKHPISCLPIVDEQQQPLGMVSWRDIMRQAELKLFNGD